MADIVTTRIFSDGEKGVTAGKLNDIVGSSSIQTSFVSTKPVASSTVAGDNLLLLTSGGTYAKIDSSVFSSSIAALLPAPEPKIWAVRLNSFSSIGNGNFEVDQRRAGTATAVTTAASFACDRWWNWCTGTLRYNVQQLVNNAVIPGGSNFFVSNRMLRFTMTTTQAVLGATDMMALGQTIEGCFFRELFNDVHSVSILARSSVANLKFGFNITDAAGTPTRSLTKLCSMGAANTWQLFQLSNIPVFPPAGTWSLTPGTVGYNIQITLAAGSTYIAAANDTWQSAAVYGALGQSNFATNAGATFDLAFIQHEPGAACSTLMDVPFTGPNGNLESCQRYYQKSYPITQVPGAITSTGSAQFPALAGNMPFCYVPFKRTMAKGPTMTGYSPVTGAINTVRDITPGNVDRAVTSAVFAGDTGFSGFNVTGPNAANWIANFHYVADTGW